METEFEARAHSGSTEDPDIGRAGVNSRILEDQQRGLEASKIRYYGCSSREVLNAFFKYGDGESHAAGFMTTFGAAEGD